MSASKHSSGATGSQFFVWGGEAQASNKLIAWLALRSRQSMRRAIVQYDLAAVILRLTSDPGSS